MSHDAENKESNQNSSNSGLFITKGMLINFDNFSLKIGDDGEIEVGQVSISTALDMCPYWLDIAYEHLLLTEQAHNDLMVAKELDNGEMIGKALSTEFTSGMQAIMASAIAIDAFYACIKERIEIHEDLIRVWRENKLSRYKQIVEVIRIASPMKHETVKEIRGHLKGIFHFRNMAVHPPSKKTLPLLHPELNKITDWRYVEFRYRNAKIITGDSLSIIAQIASRAHNDKFINLTPYFDALTSSLKPLLERWYTRYGKLFG